MKRTITIIILFLNFVSIWAQYDRIGKDFGNGLRRVKKGNYYGFINATGKEVIPVKYIYLDEFTNGRTRVVAGYKDAKSEERYGMIDKTGKTVIPFKYDFIGYDYGNGLRKVRLPGGDSWRRLQGFINQDGKEVIPLKYYILDDFSDGKTVIYAESEEDEGSGYLIDKTGKRVLPYKVVDHLNGKGLIRIKDHIGRIGLVDAQSGNLLIPPTYQSLSYPTDGMIPVATDYEKYGFLDSKSLKMLITPQYERVGWFSEGLASVQKNGKVGFINKQGEIIIPFLYDNNTIGGLSGYFSNGLCVVSKDGKQALIDKNGNEKTPFIYSTIVSGFDIIGFNGVIADRDPNNVFDTSKDITHYFDTEGNKYATAKERDIAQFAIMKSKADNGDEKFYAIIADIYSDENKSKAFGLISKDDVSALKWFLKAAEADDKSYYEKHHIVESDIYYFIAKCYEEGIGVPIDLGKARSWYVKSAGCNVGSYLGKWLYAQSRLNELGGIVDVDPNPQPEPTYNYATITWNTFQDKTTQKEYQLRLGINSDSRIENITITINGIQDRGIKTVNSSDYDLTINRTLTLNEGENVIKVNVRNAAGTAQEEKTIVYRPLGGELPSIEWLDFAATANKKEYQMKLGIKSMSKVEEVNVTLNGALTRGIKTVASDGYDLTVDRTLSLSEGLNRIVVSVRNGDGISTSEKVITYQGNNPTPVFNDKRIAFVIGNSHYSNSEMNLANPENDAKDVAEKLKGLGFEVVLKLDATLEDMDKGLSSFREKAKEYDVAMFYYAGHGIQSKGVNYLIPTNINNLAEDNMKYKCVDMERVLDVMEDSKCKLKIVILDACRNDPLSRRWHRSAGTRGLSLMNAPTGTIISFSTAPGSTALDGKGRNSPYTEAFLNTLDMPNLDVFHFFQKVGASVLDKTQRSQNPWLSVSFTGDFYFNKQ